MFLLGCFQLSHYSHKFNNHWCSIDSFHGIQLHFQRARVGQEYATLTRAAGSNQWMVRPSLMLVVSLCTRQNFMQQALYSIAINRYTPHWWCRYISRSLECTNVATRLQEKLINCLFYLTKHKF